MRWIALTTLVCIVAVGLCPTSEAAPIPYRFDLIGELGSASPLKVNINNSGTVAFLGIDSSGQGAVFTGSGGSLTTVADVSGVFSTLGIPVINDAGTVSFSAHLDSGAHGIFSISGGAITPIALNGGDLLSLATAELAINASGEVAFEALLVDGNRAIYRGSGGALTTIVDTTGAFTTIGLPRINDGGTVSFTGMKEDGTRGVYTGDGGVLSPVSTAGLSYSSINDGGAVAFAALLPGGGIGKFISDGGTVTPIADDRGDFLVLGPTNEMNDDGDVAFAAFLATGSAGVFTGGDVVDDVVIMQGDAIFGTTLTVLDFYPVINDRGQIAFSAYLADGRNVVIRATPEDSGDPTSPVPEPASGALISLALLGLALQTVRGRSRRVTSRRPPGGSSAI